MIGDYWAARSVLEGRNRRADSPTKRPKDIIGQVIAKKASEPLIGYSGIAPSSTLHADLSSTKTSNDNRAENHACHITTGTNGSKDKTMARACADSQNPSSAKPYSTMETTAPTNRSASPCVHVPATRARMVFPAARYNKPTDINAKTRIFDGTANDSER